MSDPTIVMIKAKKLGVLLRSARLQAAKTVEESAKVIGCSKEVYESFELGERSPSLPEIEVLAYFWDVPLDYFWSQRMSADQQPSFQELDVQRIFHLRQRMIGALLRKSRLESGLTLDELSLKTGIRAGDLENYELGEVPIELPQMEVIANALGCSVSDFQDRNGPVGKWLLQKNALKNFLELPLEMQDFITKPINRPYLEVAKRLSTMSVERLRSVAEGLLEITL